MPQPTPNPINEMNYNAPQPVEPMNTTINNQPETLYQPLSEQKPSFAPIDASVNMMNNQMAPNTNVVEPVVNPVPVEPQPVIMQQPAPEPIPVQEPMVMQPMQPEFQTPVQPIGPEPVNMAAAPMTNPMPNPVPVQPIPNPEGNTVPNPITPPQPVSPQPINFTYGNQNNNGFMQ